MRGIADRGRIQEMLTKAWPLTYGARLDDLSAEARRAKAEAPEARSRAETRSSSAPHLLEGLQALQHLVDHGTTVVMIGVLTSPTSTWRI